MRRDYERESSEKAGLQNQSMEYEREIALIKHDLKEVNSSINVSTCATNVYVEVSN